MNSVKPFLRRKFLKGMTSKTAKNVQKGQKLQQGSTDFHQNLTTDRSHYAKYFYLCQNLAKPTGFGDICKNLLSDPYVFSNGGNVFSPIKNPNGQFVMDTLIKQKFDHRYMQKSAV